MWVPCSPVISALGWLREQEQSTGETMTGCLPASASRSLGQKRPGPVGALAVDQHDGSPRAVLHSGCGLLISTISRGPTVFLF